MNILRRFRLLSWENRYNKDTEIAIKEANQERHPKSRLMISEKNFIPNVST